MKLSCTDFSFPLLPHETALQIISLLGLRGVDIGLFAGRSHLRPETELRKPEQKGAALRQTGGFLVCPAGQAETPGGSTNYVVNLGQEDQTK